MAAAIQSLAAQVGNVKDSGKGNSCPSSQPKTSEPASLTREYTITSVLPKWLILC